MKDPEATKRRQRRRDLAIIFAAVAVFAGLLLNYWREETHVPAPGVTAPR